MIQLIDIHKSFDSQAVLDGLNLEIETGKITVIIGQSGGGKSILLKHMIGLIRPDKGEVLVEGVDIARLNDRKLNDMRKSFGMLFQGAALFDSMTVFDNVAFPLREKSKLSEEEIRERVFNELDQVGLVGAESKYPSQISGGMIKRAALARALVREPEIMLFDEPTTGLDPIISQAILNLIDSCHKRLKFTAIIVTHEIPKVFDIVNKVAMLYEGKILTMGSPEEVMVSKDPVVQQFITGSVEGPIQYHEIHPDAVDQKRREKRVYPKWREWL